MRAHDRLVIQLLVLDGYHLVVSVQEFIPNPPVLRSCLRVAMQVRAHAVEIKADPFELIVG